VLSDQIQYEQIFVIDVRMHKLRTIRDVRCSRSNVLGLKIAASHVAVAGLTTGSEPSELLTREDARQPS